MSIFPHSAVLLNFFVQDFQLSENIQFWSGHGWMTVIIVGWLAPLAVIPRRMMGWLTVFCLVRQLIVAREYLFSSLINSPFELLEPTAWLSRLLGIVCAWLLWEMITSLRAEGGRRPWSHWLARAGWAGLLAGGLVGGLDWAGVIEAAVMAPTGFLLATVWWRHGPREEAPGMRLAGFGFGLFACATSFSALAGALGSAWLDLFLHLVGAGGWLVAAGIGWAVLRHYRTFSRLALTFFLVLFLYPVWLAITYGVVMPPTVARTKEQLLGWGEGMISALPMDAVGRLASGTTEAADRPAIEAELRRVMTSSAFVRRVYLWRPENGRRRVFAGLGPGRPWTMHAVGPTYWHELPDQAALAAGQRIFESPYDAHDGELIDLTLPLRAQPGGAVVAWVTIEANSRPYWRAITSSFVVLVVFFDCFGPYLNAVAILSWRRATERRRLEQLLKVQNSDRAKTEFLAFLGHELRTPLQTILSRAELLRAAPASARHASAIEGQGRLLLRLVNDLLDLGTIEAGHFVLHTQPFSLRTALVHTEDLVRPLAEAKGLALHFTVAPDVPDGLLGDEARLRQILGNLLANAVKYTPHGEVRLEISASAESSVLTFRVRDTGPGLPKDKIPLLFTLFTRLDAGDTFTREGTGVGLALVRRLCGLMGGGVTAGNRVGGGAEFTVQLPFARAVLPEMVSPSAVASGAPRRILIAEDNTPAREVLAEALRELGHEVTTAVDGPAALAACDRAQFDVVVLDVNLPGVDGIEVARRLRAQPGCPRLVGCSAEAFDHVRDAALAAGMDEFLQKPVALAALAAALSPPISDNIFDRLGQPATATRARELQREEWTRLRTETEAALAAGDPTALRRLGHYLCSTALLIHDEALVKLSKQLGAAAVADAPALLAKVEAHLAAWPVS
ncbi:MAG: response regulator [Opitutaceae bacterium]|nr:response regulator [Opitutaceae bacterium]